MHIIGWGGGGGGRGEWTRDSEWIGDGEQIRYGEQCEDYFIAGEEELMSGNKLRSVKN